MGTIVDRAAIAQVYSVVARHVRVTPVIEISGEDFGLDDCRLVLKLEQLQHGGSFKARGAFANLSLRKIPPAGVVAASGGNHGVAVALAAHRLGIPATIFVPRVASAAKMRKIRDHGAELVVVSDRYADALAASEEHARLTGALAVHAYDQPETLLGQGTVALELERQAPDIDALLVAVGGGGLIGGVAAYYAGRVDVVGVEPATAPTLTEARRAGKPVDAPAGGIAADSLAPKRVGELMFPIAQRYVRDVLLVSDEDIAETQRALWSTLRVAVEPGGAAAFSALLSRRYVPRPRQRVGVLVCGANTDAVDFERSAA